MIQTVVKRDGRIVGFNEEKIVTAIRKAMLHTDKGEDIHLIQQITDHVSFHGTFSNPRSPHWIPYAAFSWKKKTKLHTYKQVMTLSKSYIVALTIL